MQKWDELQKQLAASGKMDTLKDLANSSEMSTLAGKVDAEAIKAAAQKQDPAVLRAVLEQVLSTAEGKRLAAKVKDAMRNG